MFFKDSQALLGPFFLTKLYSISSLPLSNFDLGTSSFWEAFHTSKSGLGTLPKALSAYTTVFIPLRCSQLFSSLVHT